MQLRKFFLLIRVDKKMRKEPFWKVKKYNFEMYTFLVFLLPVYFPYIPGKEKFASPP